MPLMKSSIFNQSLLLRYVEGSTLYEGSVRNFYSPFESPDASDDEDEVENHHFPKPHTLWSSVRRLWGQGAAKVQEASRPSTKCTGKRHLQLIKVSHFAFLSEIDWFSTCHYTKGDSKIQRPVHFFTLSYSTGICWSRADNLDISFVMFSTASRYSVSCLCV